MMEKWQNRSDLFCKFCGKKLSRKASMEAEVMRFGSYTESRMREKRTYGSMRGGRSPQGRSALLYTL